MGDSETDSTIVESAASVSVRRHSQQSLNRDFLKGYQQKGFRITLRRACGGSQIDPAKIAIRTSRACLEGGLFRAAVAEKLQDHEIRT